MSSRAVCVLLLAVVASVVGAVRRIAVIGEGAVGTSTALALIERDPSLDITVFYDVPYNQTVSWGPAGLFRVDRMEHREFGKRSFPRYAQLFRTLGGEVSGIHLVSGHILSNNLTSLVEQELIYGDVVYNFGYLNSDQISQLFGDNYNEQLHAIHYTAYTTEGGKYVPWMKQQCLDRGVKFINRRINTVRDLIRDFDVIINCAGLNGGKVAGDGDDRNMFPIRGIIFEVDAPWHSHFLFKEFETFTIPTTDKVFIGSVKQAGRYDLEITPEDRADILGRYYKLQPGIKDSSILGQWSGLRPGRNGGIRLEMTTIRFPFRTRSTRNKVVQIVHNYGHGGHGLTLGWGCAEEVADLVLGNRSRTSVSYRR